MVVAVGDVVSGDSEGGEDGSTRLSMHNSVFLDGDVVRISEDDGDGEVDVEIGRSSKISNPQSPS